MTWFNPRKPTGVSSSRWSGLLRVLGLSSSPSPEVPLESLTVHEASTSDAPAVHFAVDFGTSSTVIAAFRKSSKGTQEWQLLVGDELFSSAIAVDVSSIDLSSSPFAWLDGPVVEVGPKATIPEAGRRRESSLKRVIELLSRQDGDHDRALTALVAQYVVKALETEGSRIGPESLTRESRIFVSVPNGFNQRATRIISEGVVMGLCTASGRQDEDIPASHIHVIREGEAVARYWEATQQDWEVARLSTRPAQAPPRRRASTLAIVLDIGAGTTDLTVLERHSSEALIALMNAGAPLGGTDVDRLILCALAKDGYWQANKDPGARQDAELHARNGKETLHILTDVDELTSLSASSSLPQPDQRDPIDAKKEIAGGLKNLIALSIEGLFSLVPPSLTSRGIDTILLTGRGSRLPEVMEAVEEQAERLGDATAFFPPDPSQDGYVRKLAVVYGCMASLDYERDFPASTFGRRLRVTERDLRKSTRRTSWPGVRLRRGDLELHLEPHIPANSDFPVLWRRRPLRDTSLWHEQFTSATRDFEDKEFEDKDLVPLGLLRIVAHRSRAGSQAMYVLRSTQDRYFSLDGDGWQPVERQLDRATRSVVTGLPVGFPNE